MTAQPPPCGQCPNRRRGRWQQRPLPGFFLSAKGSHRGGRGGGVLSCSSLEPASSFPPQLFGLVSPPPISMSLQRLFFAHSHQLAAFCQPPEAGPPLQGRQARPWPLPSSSPRRRSLCRLSHRCERPMGACRFSTEGVQATQDSGRTQETHGLTLDVGLAEFYDIQPRHTTGSARGGGGMGGGVL